MRTTTTSLTPRSLVARRLAGITLALAASAGLVACGNDDDASLSAAACDAAVSLSSSMAQAPEDPAAIGEFASSTMVPLASTLKAELDGDAADAAATIEATFRQIAETGDPSALDDPAAAAASSTVGAAVHEGCGFEQVEIGAVEYAFTDAPDEVPAGMVSFALENKGVEDHEMVLFRRADGVTENFEELSQLPEEELFSKVTFTGVAFGAPGTTNYAAIDLEPGTYFMVCFLPQGGSEDAPPHFMGGMQHMFVVS